MKFVVLAKISLISYILFGLIGTLHAKEESDEWSIQHIVIGGVLGAVAIPLLAVGAPTLIPVAIATGAAIGATVALDTKDTDDDNAKGKTRKKK